MDRCARRRLLRALAGGTVVGLAGCSGLDSDGDRIAIGSNTSDPTQPRRSSPPPTSSSPTQAGTVASTGELTVESAYGNVDTAATVTVSLPRASDSSAEGLVVRYPDPDGFDEHGTARFDPVGDGRFEATLQTFGRVGPVPYSIRTDDGSVLLEDSLFVRPVAIGTDSFVAFDYGRGIEQGVTREELGRFVAGQGLEKTLQAGASAALSALGSKLGLATATATAVLSKTISLAMTVSEFVPDANPSSTVSASVLRRREGDSDAFELTDEVELTRRDDVFPALTVTQGAESATSLSVAIGYAAGGRVVADRTMPWPSELRSRSRYLVIPREPLSLEDADSIRPGTERELEVVPQFRRAGDAATITQVPASGSDPRSGTRTVVDDFESGGLSGWRSEFDTSESRTGEDGGLDGYEVQSEISPEGSYAVRGKKGLYGDGTSTILRDDFRLETEGASIRFYAKLGEILDGYERDNRITFYTSDLENRVVIFRNKTKSWENLVVSERLRSVQPIEIVDISFETSTVGEVRIGGEPVATELGFPEAVEDVGAIRLDQGHYQQPTDLVVDSIVLDRPD